MNRNSARRESTETAAGPAAPRSPVSGQTCPGRREETPCRRSSMEGTVTAGNRLEGSLLRSLSSGSRGAALPSSDSQTAEALVQESLHRDPPRSAPSHLPGRRRVPEIRPRILPTAPPETAPGILPRRAPSHLPGLMIPLRMPPSRSPGCRPAGYRKGRR